MWLIILPLVTACAFVALFVFACLKLNWAMKAKNACQRHWRAACSSSLAKTGEFSAVLTFLCKVGGEMLG